MLLRALPKLYLVKERWTESYDRIKAPFNKALQRLYLMTRMRIRYAGAGLHCRKPPHRQERTQSGAVDVGLLLPWSRMRVERCDCAADLCVIFQICRPKNVSQKCVTAKMTLYRHAIILIHGERQIVARSGRLLYRLIAKIK